MDASKWIIGLVILLVLGGGFYMVSSQKSEEQMEKKSGEAMEKTDSMMDNPTDTIMTGEEAMKKDTSAMMAKAGTYESYAPEKLALAETGNVVLFFRASWCPTCRALDADIMAHRDGIPEGVTILDVDYDNSTALKQKYGVTIQHTLVQVDVQGNLITKWTGSPTLAQLVEKVK